MTTSAVGSPSAGVPRHELRSVRVPLAELTPHPGNARQGNVPMIVDSLRMNGQYRALVVNLGTRTGRPMEILAGHHVALAAAELGWSEVAVQLVDVGDEAATRILLADNRANDLAGYDERLLAELLTDLPDLDGTGYDPADLELILSRVNADMDVFPDYDAGGDDDGDGAGEEIACPQCGHTWIPG